MNTKIVQNLVIFVKEEIIKLYIIYNTNVRPSKSIIIWSGAVLAIGLIGQLDQLDIGLIGLIPISPNNQLDNWT